MIPVYKLEHNEYNLFIAYDKDPMIGKAIYLEKELNITECLIRIGKILGEDTIILKK